MFARERQEKIYRMLQKDGAVTTANLVKSFCVSVETVRKDLLFMEQAGKLVRVHGGAVVQGDMGPDLNLSQRNKEHSGQKEELAAAAAKFVSNGDIIGIDSGSTAIYFAEALRGSLSKLTVVTHSADVFNILKNHGDFSVILCGGYYIREENAFCSVHTLDMLRSLHVQKSFIFPTAVSLNYGIFDYNRQLLQIQRQIIHCSDEVFILADSSKFEKKALLKLDDMKKEYRYITDASLPEELRRLYARNDIRIITP